ncbi:chromophore lyase CpcT/CpeT [Aquimarina algicola]|uniref:CpeT/CpcT family protein n=1 Tax=Aquimarina algicola TaxID=2589995 RepID=A0A504J514_9FLAO|nr:chromophore lyase CpcT/CpeT [Aquimarina algicola]TPN81281.1 hypothetical protein FHK87_25180 [Aquimarina algicola]
MKQFLLIISLLILFSGCVSAPVKDKELHNLVSLLIGDFTNKEQAENDPSFSQLSLINIRIWKNKSGYWVYSQLFDAKKENIIYSQRVLFYERVDSITFASKSYTINNAKEYKEAWKNPKILKSLKPEDLEIRNGCDVYFKKKTSTIYSGKTNKGSCSSSINFVDHISSNFVISKNKLSVWNRGYDEKGKQVWGKIKGPYKFRKNID